MTPPVLAEIEGDTQTLDPTAFSAAHWLTYFQDNKAARVKISFPVDQSVVASVRSPLIRSLQRFQIGETGEGKHLRKFARLTGDRKYEECIDFFIKEEQFHASVLASIIQSLDGTLISWHWTDVAFIGLRRMLGLKTEVFILLIAEIIGKCFYRVCADKLKNPLMSDAFSLIVLDEIGHLEFHASFLHCQTKSFPLWAKKFVHDSWKLIFMAACMVFIADHKRTLRALNVDSKDFLKDCTRTFNRTAMRALDLPRPTLLESQPH